MNSLRKKMLATGSLALLMGAGAANAGVTFPYDADGPGPLLLPAIDLSALDWDPGNALSVFDRNLDPASGGAPKVGDTLTSYYQAKLQAFKQADNNPRTIFATAGGVLGSLNYQLDDIPVMPNLDFEWTAVAKFREKVTAVNPVTGEIKLEVIDDPNNYFKVFYDAVKATRADDLAGTGFNEGLLILEARGGKGTGNFDPSADPQGDPPNIVDFDQFNGASVPWNVDPVDGVGNYQTVDGQGSFSVNAKIAYYDPAFLGLGAIPLMGGEMLITTTDSTQALPFDAVNPSIRFFDMDPNNDGNPIDMGTFIPNLGLINAGLFAPGDDAIQFEADANTSFDIATGVPEPATAMLGIMGMLGLAFGGRRSRKA